MKRICVFCGSSMGQSQVYREAAASLGRLLAEKGFGLVYGGANVGLMKELADATLAAGGKVIGVMPHQLISKEIAHPDIHQLHAVTSMAERKDLMVSLSDAFIALPGGYGTLDELSEILTFNQLRISDKPLGLLNIEGYFDLLLRFFDRGVEDGFVRKEHRQNLIVTPNNEEMLTLLNNWKPVETTKWIADIRQESQI